MYFAWVVGTSSGWFAHKVYCETPEAGEKIVKAQYGDLGTIERIRSGPNDEKDSGHALYERACQEAAKRNKEITG